MVDVIVVVGATFYGLFAFSSRACVRARERACRFGKRGSFVVCRLLPFVARRSSFVRKKKLYQQWRRSGARGFVVVVKSAGQPWWSGLELVVSLLALGELEDVADWSTGW
jgi:hypothetical protein